ncbi:MAG: hypothetical protein NTW86_11970, partial [Candidatus Sumerlaeota bacterium]|nr:hypothetical protein [Candidatus Sumerlaeota bacterium]
MQSTRIHRGAGVLALLGLLAVGSWARAAETPDEQSLRAMFDRATRQEHSVLNAETAVQSMRMCFPDSPALPE